MHTLECLAARERLSNKRIHTPIMYRSFSAFVYSLGSLSEVGFMTWFYLLTNPLRALRMLPVVLDLLRHRRLHIRARRLTPEGTKQLEAILDKAETSVGVALSITLTSPAVPPQKVILWHMGAQRKRLAKS